MKNLSRSLVCGVGRNDAGYPVYITSNIDGRQKNIWRCPFYTVWTHMLARCYSEKSKSKHPTYLDCSVAPEWLSFSTFRDWMEKQEWEGRELDKDIISPGNKIYGPSACVFLTKSLNNFLTDRRKSRGNWPIGVYWDERLGKFKAQCNDPFTKMRGHLGYYDCPNAAQESWRQRKHELSCKYADMQVDPRIAMALRTRFSATGVAA